MINLLQLTAKTDCLEQKYAQKLNVFLSKISNKKFTLNINNIFLLYVNLLINYPHRFLFLIKQLFGKLPIQILIKIYKIYKGKDKYYSSFQDSIIDGIERKTGDIRLAAEIREFLNQYIIEFLLRSINLILLIEIIDIYRELEAINAMCFEQHDGYPFGAISSYCQKKKMYVCTGSMQIKPFENYSENLSFIMSRSIVLDRIVLPKDLRELKNISDYNLNKNINLIKKDFTLKRDPICSPEFIKYDQKYVPKDSSYYSKQLKNGKKNGLVLIHLLTDIARKRNEDLWFKNYLEWLYETIKFCSKNKNINWIFKAHPQEPNYPIMKKHAERIKRKIRQNKFIYIKSKEQFLHEEVSKIASVIVTCHGTCKIEYPALYNIPVISCTGHKCLSYYSDALPFTAKSQIEYKNLILKAHEIKLSQMDIRRAKELFVFNKVSSGRDPREEPKVKIHLDFNNEKVFRNY